MNSKYKRSMVVILGIHIIIFISTCYGLYSRYGSLGFAKVFSVLILTFAIFIFFCMILMLNASLEFIYLTIRKRRMKTFANKRGLKYERPGSFKFVDFFYRVSERVYLNRMSGEISGNKITIFDSYIGSGDSYSSSSNYTIIRFNDEEYTLHHYFGRLPSIKRISKRLNKLLENGKKTYDK